MESVEEKSKLINLLWNFTETEMVSEEEKASVIEAILKLVEIEFEYIKKLDFFFKKTMIVFSSPKYKNKEKMKKDLIEGFKNLDFWVKELKEILNCIKLFEKHKSYIKIPKDCLDLIIAILFITILINNQTDNEVTANLYGDWCEHSHVEYIPLPMIFEKDEYDRKASLLKDGLGYIKEQRKMGKKEVKLLKRCNLSSWEELEEILAKGKQK